ncbi:methanogenic corrinoid protein MtbC1 [Lapillicoccus jejuensis]|uniref:Methanogenic corrinoid protein MtbC1 n=1 Tax=Lapillicoccus jejuensis TaxID=402171 RepID=A0A542E621_9MICO|nr:methanogenic corrinoid protein MtbC1 [Lapillicoccus jejuensis]
MQGNGRGDDTVADDGIDWDDHAGRGLEIVTRLHALLDVDDTPSAGRLVDEVLSRMELADAVSSVLMPFLRHVGARWESGQLSVAQEHWASQLVRNRLAGLWDRVSVTDGPVALVACPPGERHDIAPLAFCVLLAHAGWQARFYGADTPLPDLAAVAARVRPDVVVLAASRRSAFLARAQEVRRLALDHTVAIAGSGASAQVAAELDAHWLGHDVADGVAEASRLVRRADAARPGAAS